MKKRWFDIFVWITTIIFLIILMTMSNRVPLHWNYNWKVVEYGSRYTLLFIMLLPLISYYGMLLSMRIDPKKKKFGDRKKTYEILRKFITFILILLVLFFIYMAKNPNANGMIIMMLLLGTMYTVMGNYMPKIPQNYFVGIKTPWTLSDETVWKKTHLVGGYTFVILGLLCILSGITSFEHSFIVVIAGVIVVIGITFFYSYYIFKKLGQEEDKTC